jgi:hypothetical protein
MGEEELAYHGGAQQPKLFTINDAGEMVWHPHEFQQKMLESYASRTIALKGWRAGFTSWSAKLLETEMKRCGPGNLNLSYFAISPTHTVGSEGLIPAIQTVFCTHMQYAIYNKQDHKFTITPDGERALWGHKQKEPTKIVCCHASDPNSFASMTALGGIADEIGQKEFKLESWNVLDARCSTSSSQVAPNNRAMGFPADLKMGRIFGGTTVYQINWVEDLYNQHQKAIHEATAQMKADCAAAGSVEERTEILLDYQKQGYHGQIHPSLNFVRFDSTYNPLISREYFDRRRRELQPWFFDMRYRAIFRRPAGVIFEEWDPNRHVVAPFEAAYKWPREIYIDFGKRNFHAQLWAIEPDEARNRQFLLESYHDSELDNTGRAKALVENWGTPVRCVAGQISEDDARAELAVGGLLAIAPAYKDLWLGINNMASAIRQNKIFVFANNVSAAFIPRRESPFFQTGSQYFIDEVRNYSRPVDDNGNVNINANPENHESYHCFVAGTMIETSRGSVPIEKVRMSDLVRTRQGLRPVAKIGSYFAPGIREVVFSNGVKLVGTADHPIWVLGKGFVAIDSLLCGDEVFNREEFTQPHVLRVSDHPGAVVYNFAVAEVPEYFANGVLVHNSLDPLRYGASHRFSYLNHGDPTPRAPVRNSATDDAPFALPQSRVGASNVGSGFATAIAQKYGISESLGQPYLDIDL